jgi:hypothetical protein
MIIVAAIAAATLAGCSGSLRDRNTGVGALVGAGTGAVIGAATTGTPQGTAAGAAIGGATGGFLGYVLTPSGRCYARTRHGRLIRVRCPY